MLLVTMQQQVEQAPMQLVIMQKRLLVMPMRWVKVQKQQAQAVMQLVIMQKLQR